MLSESDDGSIMALLQTRGFELRTVGCHRYHRSRSAPTPLLPPSHFGRLTGTYGAG
jgi:hypothetical protein